MSARAPRVVTSATNARASNGYGPTENQRQTSTSNLADQMSSKKRPLQSLGRKSPPGKRVRSMEEDRYAHTGSPTTPFSPPPSRHNSIHGIDVPVPAGPAPKHWDVRRIDQPRTSRDNVDLMDAVASPLAHGEIATPRSGDSTPQHFAPPAPSMVATPTSTGPPLYVERNLHSMINVLHMVNAEQKNIKLHGNQSVAGTQSGTVASLRLLKEKKNAQARLEYDHCKQNLGPLADSVHAIMASHDGAEPARQSEIDQKNHKQLLAQLKAQQIEIQLLKAEREKILSRLDELEELKTLRKDTDSLLEQMRSLEGVRDQLVKLEQLPASVERLQADVKGLEQKNQTPSAASSLTPETVQSMITDRIGPAVEAFSSTQEPKWTNMRREIDGIKRSTDISTLLEFKKRVENDDWPKQLSAFNERLDLVSKSQKITQADVARQNDSLAKQNQKLDDMAKDLSASSKRIESCERASADLTTTIGRQKHEIDTELRKLFKHIGEPDNKPGHVAKPVLNRLKDLEQQSSKSLQRLKSSETALGSLDKKLTTFTEACEKSSLEQKQQLVSLLGETPRSAAKPVLGRILDLEQAFGQFDGQYRAFQSASSLFRNDIDRNRNNIDKNKQLLDELVTEMSRCKPEKDSDTPANNHQESTKELPNDFKEFSAKLARMEKQGEEHVASLDLLKEDLVSIHGNLFLLDQSLLAAEKQAHELGNRVKVAEENTLQTFQSRIDDLSRQIQSLSDQRQQQHQGTPQPALTPEERANLQRIPQLGLSFNTIAQRLEGLDLQLHLGHRVQAVEKALQTLQERYDNISTDVIYQRMVKWFLESYGNTQDYLNVTRWLMANHKQLTQLVSITPDLVNAWQEMALTRQTVADTAGAVRDLVMKVDAIATTTTGHGSIIAALEQRTGASDRSLILHGNRIDEIVTSVDSLKNSTITDQIQESVGALESSLKNYDNHIVNLENKVNALESIDMEKIGQFQGMIPQILLAIYQLQEVIPSILADLPGGGFKVDFTLDFKNLAIQLGNKAITFQTTS